MRKVVRRRNLYKFGAIVCFLLLALFLFFYEPKDLDNEVKILLIENSIRSPFNQGECLMPILPVDNPEIMKFYKPAEKLNCGNPLDDWVTCDKSICFVKPEISSMFGEVTCSYTDLIRKSDYKVKYGETTKTKEPYILQASDFVKVACYADGGKSYFGMACGIRDRAPPPPTAPQFKAINNKIPIPNMNFISDGKLQRQQQELPSYFNVLIIGFDSMSRNAVIRKLPKTSTFLVNHLNAVILKGYNIVGDGTPQALIPLLTGFTEIELPETRHRKRNAKSVDIYPMIWKEYKRQGYYTQFNEDVPNIGTFTYRMKGFGSEQPVDHYLRTFYLEAENILSSSAKHCIGHQPDHVVMLDYTKNFMMKYKDAPKFAFSFHGGLSHDSINDIGAADDDIVTFLRTLQMRSSLNNTILIFMSDHGNRFSEVRATLQGKQEERLPFFSFAFPETFKMRFPQEYANFVENAEHLVTPFDVHATLQHILRLQGGVAAQLNETQNIVLSSLASKRAMSLFNPIPRNRSCADAYIEPHWCACLNWETIALNDTNYEGLLIKLAGSVVDVINDANKNFKNLCAKRYFQKINWAMRLRPHNELLRYKRPSDFDGFLPDLTDKTKQTKEIFQLQILVGPGGALYEASVTYDTAALTASTKLSEISRINEYGAQANCIYDVNPELRKYCYCNVQ